MWNWHFSDRLAHWALVLTFGLGLLPESRAASPVPGGPCDSPYPDAQGNMTIVCHGLDDKQLRLLPHVSSLANRILQSSIEGERLESETDGILNILEGSPAPKAAALETLPVKNASTPRQIPPASPPPSVAEVITYDYRGFKTSSIRGPLYAEAQTSLAYQDMLALQKKGDWKKLLKRAAREAKEAPGWLTPYAFKAVALHHLGRNSEAISALDYVDQRSAGNPDYDQARKMLKQLKSVP
jgi:hypothetical protein